jgi:hypothetical protein
MVDKLKILDCDIIYLSYDEPNAEKNYADLCSKVPWAKRVHGVKGSDAAHKACAELSETDRFITVDGDNIVNEKFFDQELDLSKYNLEKSVISWCGRNIINGLTYGNGGLKCWPKEYVLNMRTHENADPNDINAQVEFCWDAEYIQMNSQYSDVYNNATPHQAWRAGFREGVKLALNQGERPKKEDFFRLHWRCLHLLYVWSMVGADVENGRWAVYGARQGLYKTMCTDWNYVNVRDFEYLNNLWEQLSVTEETIDDEIEDLGDKLIEELNIPIAVTPLDAGQSSFFKTIYQTPSRKPSQQFVIDPE